MKKLILFLSFILMSAGLRGQAILPVDYTFSGGKNSLPVGVTQSGLGTDYAALHSPYLLKFDGDNDYIQIRVDAAAEQIIFGVKKIGGATNSTFTLLGSQNGSSWSNIQTFSIKGSTNVVVNCTTTVAINTLYRYFKFKFTKASNVGFGTLKISKATPSTKYTVKFINCDTLYVQQTDVIEGTKISEFPDNIEPNEYCKKNGWEFIGWTKNGIDTIHSIIITKNDTLKALYKISDIGTTYAIDTLTANDFTATGTSYTEFSNVVKRSGAVYAGLTAKSNTGAIQLRATSPAGIISTSSGGILCSAKVIWNSNTLTERWLKFYCSDTAFTTSESLHNYIRTEDSIKNGVLNIILKPKSYLGISSKTGALYVDTIFITWSHGEIPTYSLNPKCYDAGVSVAHWDENSVKFDIDDFGDSVQVILSNTKDTLYKKTREDDYSIKFDKTDLKNLKCTDLKLTTFKTNDTTCIRHYLIPIMISNNTNVLCDSCNIVILPGGQLNITKDTVGIDVVVYEEGRLKVNSGKTFKINSLVLRKENNKVPYLINNGTITLASDSNYFFEIRTDADDWRWTTLPASHKVSNIRNHIGNPIKFREEVFVKHYNGEERAKSRSNGWQHVSADTIFTSGQGFLFGIDVEGSRKNVYRFKFPNSAVQLETEAKTINGLRAWGCNNKDLAPNHKGWNLIGNPFADNDTTDIISPVKVGKLVLDSSATPWNGKWVYKAGSEVKNLRYAVIPVLDRECTADEAAAGGYASELLDDYVLSPFSSFFVQIGGNEDDIQALVLNPIINTPINKIVAKYSQPEEELFLRIKVGDRKTGMFISNKFTDAYEPGDDLESRYPIYQNIGGYKLLYSAINDSIIENGVFVNTPEGHLILDPKVNKNSFEYIYVYHNNTWYNILYEELDVTDSFIIYAKRKQIATDLEIIPTEGIYKFTDGRNVYINRNNKIYNIIGALYR